MRRRSLHFRLHPGCTSTTSRPCCASKMASPSSRTSPKSWAAPERRSLSSNATGRGFREVQAGLCGVVLRTAVLHPFASARGCARPPHLKHLLPSTRHCDRAMSEENVATARRHTEAWNRRDLATWLASFASDGEIDWSRSGGPLNGVYRDKGELEVFWHAFWSTFEDV